MVKHITVCDGCGKTLERTAERFCRVFVATDTFTDGAGSSDYIPMEVDLCQECVTGRLLPTLEKLAGRHPIVEALLEYRRLEKLRSTYLEPLPRLADEQGRIHTTFNQTATATGRLSSSNPNLQNIPVRGDFGRRMRSCFIPAPGYTLVSADYSQIELRVLAHLSGDPALLAAFRNNEDIHSRTAGLLFDVELPEVTPDMRRSAKTINFGLIYGMGAQKLAQELKLRVEMLEAMQ